MGLVFRRKRNPITFRDALAAAREIGLETLEEMSRPDAAAAIAAVALKARNTSLDDPSIDWDALIAFIERLLPLILQIIEMFGGL